MEYPWGHLKRYNDYSSYIKRTFGERVQKVSVNAGFTCPNRDGTKGVGGCVFCNNSTFNPAYCGPELTVVGQINKGISFFALNIKRKNIWLISRLTQILMVS